MIYGETCLVCGFRDHLAEGQCGNCQNEADDVRVKAIHDALRAVNLWPRLYVDDYDHLAVCVAREAWYGWTTDNCWCGGGGVVGSKVSPCEPGWVANGNVFQRVADWLLRHGDPLDVLAGQELLRRAQTATVAGEAQRTTSGTAEAQAAAGARFEHEIGGEA